MNIALLILRLSLGVIFLVHGHSKFKMWNPPSAPSGGGGGTPQMPVSMLRIMKFLSVTETLGGIALILGFMTPFAAGGVGLIMIGAIYMKITKWHTPFSTTTQTGWEFDLINLAAAFVLVMLGPGQIALDFIIR